MFRNLNLPNKLTMIRIFLVPVFIILLALSSVEGLKFFAFIALGIYVIASVTDFVDGKIARSKNLITDFGKIMDPLADKILVASGFVMLSYLGIVPGWISAVIIARDFYVDGLRMILIMKNIVAPASLVGKLKTCFEMVAIVFAIASIPVSKSPEFFAFLNNGANMDILPLLFNTLFSMCLVGAFVATIVSIITYTYSYNKAYNDACIEKSEDSNIAENNNVDEIVKEENENTNVEEVIEENTNVVENAKEENEKIEVAKEENEVIENSEDITTIVEEIKVEENTDSKEDNN